MAYKDNEKQKAASRRWRQEHPEQIHWLRYLNVARRKKYSFTLTREEFNNLIRQPCSYCGARPKPVMGIDRVDNNQGYTTKNSVPCCSECNSMKSNRDQIDFLVHVLEIAKYIAQKEGLIYGSIGNKAGQVGDAEFPAKAAKLVRKRLQRH